VPQVIKAIWSGPGLAPGPVGNTTKANKKKGEEIIEMVIAKIPKPPERDLRGLGILICKLRFLLLC
jgi:hypothetical protein